MRRAIGIALVVAVALVFLNDGGRWVNTQSRLNEDTALLAEWAASNVRDSNPAVGGPFVVAEGARRGVRVVKYDSNQDTVRVSSSTDVPGTWILGPYVAATNGTPLDEALGTPFVVRSYRQAQFQ